MAHIIFQRESLDKTRAALIRLQDGARAAGATRLAIGSDLPYASHWIEEGWRSDPRYGTVIIQYAAPPAGGTHFIQQARDELAPELPFVVAQGLPAGAAATRAQMLTFAYRVAERMREILMEKVYSVEIPRNLNGVPKWRRQGPYSGGLYNDIRVQTL